MGNVDKPYGEIGAGVVIGAGTDYSELKIFNFFEGYYSIVEYEYADRS